MRIDAVTMARNLLRRPSWRLFETESQNLPASGKERPDSRGSGFMPELESVRGLAAMSVALFHSAHVIPIEGNREVYRITLWHLDSLTVGAMRLIMVVFSGGPPVSLFFVLSGFVLMLALIRDERAPLSLSTAFAGRRFFRIYPAAAIEISLMALLIGATQRDFWLNFLFIQPTVNGATWSLIIEAVAIPFVLIAFWCCRRFGVGGLYALTAVSLVMFVLSHGSTFCLFFFMFMFGMVIAKTRPTFFSAGPLAILLCLCVLVSARFLLGYGTKLSLLIEGLGSAYLIGALAYGRRTRCHAILRKSWARFLGRISYSFYLYHPLALACFAPIILRWSLDPFVTAGLIAVTTIVVTLPISWTSFIAVELPFMRLGRFMEGRTERFFRKRRLSDVPAHLPARA